MGVQERRAREKQELRAEILDAARELFVAEGYENVSMRKIAEKIEYSPTTIYLYFEDKADLLDSVCEETLARLIEAMESQQAGEPLESLRKGMRAYIEFGVAHPNHYKVSFMQTKPMENPERCGRSHAMGTKAFDRMRLSVAECMREGLLREQDVEVTSQVLWAGIHGITSLLITHSKFPWVERDLLIDTMLSALLDGLGTHSATPAVVA